MPPPPKAVAALEAMKAIGFHSKEVGPVLKKLLKVYDNTWELIEADGYQVLLDNILEERELKANRDVQKDTVVSNDQDQNSRKRLKKLGEASSSQPMLCPEGPSEYSMKSSKDMNVSPEMNSNERKTEPMSSVSAGSKRKTRETTLPDPSHRIQNGRQNSVSREGDFITKIEVGEPSAGMEPEDAFECPVPLAIIHPIEDLNPVNSESVHKKRKNREPTSAQASHVFANATRESISREGGFKTKIKTCESRVEINAKEDSSEFPIPLAVINSPKDRNPARSRADQRHQTQDNSSVVESVAIPSAAHVENNGNTIVGSSSNENGKLIEIIKPPHDLSDITKGEERYRVSIVNEVSNERYPSSFRYIPQNMVYNNAHVNISVSKIGEDDRCANCFGDCLSVEIPCACAHKTGGEFAYTSDGLVKEVFIDEFISINQEPHKHRAYCQDCPLERCRNDEGILGKCKGHLIRKFIKECWVKCGCSMQCKNRIVQRGITSSLQVFFTPEGKGWGLRTLDCFPKGAFVCEYVGEILTVKELHNRKESNFDDGRTTIPVLLDNDWGSTEMIEDEDALCLDAAFYGNVARFVNHRCSDANLVAIPVEVETPDHHYYHVAFFSAREIKQFEELTWDYGINFDVGDQLIKPFKCRCGSKLCRDKRRSRSRSKALVQM